MADSALVVIEGGKIILQAYLNYMRQAGKTEEEAEALYRSEKSKFDFNKPSSLEDV